MNRKINIQDAIAVLGIILIQGALIPSHLSGHFPDLSLPVWIFGGLMCYMVKAIMDRDWVYIASNTIGLILNGSMIARILIAG